MGRRDEEHEVEELRARVLREAPEPGANPLRDELAELRVPEERLRYVSAKKFAELPLSRATLGGLARGKWARMTEIQRAAIPHALAGRDVLGAAKTGSGKTLAFLVPVVEKLFREKWSRLDGVGALVVSPTRELALQIFEVLRVLGAQHDLAAGLVIGGKDKGEEGQRIARMNILVCTPGRLLQHLDETAGFECNGLQVLVLDEADRILDLGFKATLLAILDALPRTRQTLLFSATQTRDVRALASLSLKQPQYIGVHEHSSNATPAKLMHHYMLVGAAQKLDVVWSFVKSHLLAKTLIFLSSCKQVQFVHAAFSALRPGVPLLCLHGRQKQMKRLAVYTDFSAKKHAVLLATDVAARGLDFPGVGWVVQADCPEDVPCYIHRVGRTARHSAGGRALLLLTEREKGMVASLEAARVRLHRLAPNSSRVYPLRAKLQALLAQRPELKHTAQRAFVSYVRSVHLQGNKEVFDARSLPLDELAASMGLLAPPRVRFLSRGADGKNWKSEAGGEEEAEGEEEEEGEEKAEEESEEEEEEELLSKAKKRKAQPRNKLMRLLHRNTSERREAGEASAVGEEEEEEALLQVKRRILPGEALPHLGGEAAAAAEAAAEAEAEAEGEAAAPVKPKKLKIRKGGTTAGGVRIVFDEEGRPEHARLEGGFARLADEKPSAARGEDRVAAVRAALLRTAEEDRARERLRVREKHKEQKRKRKLAEAEKGGGGAPPVLEGSDGEEGRGWEEEGGGAAEEGSGAEEEGVGQPASKRRAKRASGAAQLARDEADAERVLSQLLAK
ncbi:hypothetical protein AB1Y20_015811 [Prymnesium parvum]|uniref:ATP-dependent RNA helicase n=1 Tax=Prymnesium parvum TaxID=97485 RepID=A0AB34JXU3_PRYPA